MMFFNHFTISIVKSFIELWNLTISFSGSKTFLERYFNSIKNIWIFFSFLLFGRYFDVVAATRGDIKFIARVNVTVRTWRKNITVLLPRAGHGSTTKRANNYIVYAQYLATGQKKKKIQIDDMICLYMYKKIRDDGMCFCNVFSRVVKLSFLLPPTTL